MQAVGASRKVFKYIDRVPTFTNSGIVATTSQGHVGELKFENVTFAYPSRMNATALNVCFVFVFEYQ
jgi:hypothetical protein